MVLWEFDDPDMGGSWSQVNSGRILVNVLGEPDPVPKFVAIFGGGLDPDNASKGAHLYIVDIETGKALYKRALVGAVPSEPAAVDTDQNGILDTIYVGTVEGLMYKVDISDPADLSDATGMLDDPTQWVPFQIFDAIDRPIFYRPTVIFEGISGHYALAFGTGDREDIWGEEDPPEAGRFFMILDTGFVDLDLDGILDGGVLDETSFQSIAKTDAALAGAPLLAPLGLNRPGWVLQLGDDERVVTEALAISGLLVSSTFDPENPAACVFGGQANIYALLATSANAIGGATATRDRQVEGVAGRPFVSSQGFQTDDGGGGVEDPFAAADIQAIRQSLMGLFPPGCRFGSFSLNIGAGLSNRTQVPLAQIPVCIEVKNWKEF